MKPYSIEYSCTCNKEQVWKVDNKYHRLDGPAIIEYDKRTGNKTKEMWYEYLPIPEQPLYAETPVGQLEKQVDDLKLLLAEMISGGTV